MYPINALGVGATPVAAPEKDYRCDVDAMLAKVTDKTRIVAIVNPNNPTGSYLTKEEVARLHAGLPKNVLLIIDAAYAEYVSRNDYELGIGLIDTADNIVMTRTFSKVYALGALRVGWMYGPPAVVDVISRLRQPFNVNAAAQAAAVAALDDIAHTDASRSNNDIWLPWFAAECTKLGLKPLPSVGNFISVGFGSGGARGGRQRLADERRADPAHDRGLRPAGIPAHHHRHGKGNEAGAGLPRPLRRPTQMSGAQMTNPCSTRSR